MSGQVTINSTVLQLLVEKLARPVEDAARRRAVCHIIDWLGCAALGAQSPAAAGFSHITAKGAYGPCRAMGMDGRDWWYALQFNAAVGNLIEMDDVHRDSILHPGPIIIPAAIAMAEKIGASPQRLLTAIVRGYEATIRIGRALGASHYAYFHNTSTAGTFGAAAAAADLLNLNAQQTTWALANAGSRTGGLWQMRHESCETKSLHNAQAAQTGVQAALLAAEGVRGPMSLLEGRQGLFAAMAPGADAYQVVADIDDEWLIHQVSFKPWPACRHAHAAIDAALAIRSKLLADAMMADIAGVEVSTYQSAIDFCDQPAPATEQQAKFSLQHCVAVVLTEGAPWLAQFYVENLGTAEVVALRNKITVRSSAEFTARFPYHYGAHLRVTLADGRVIEHQQFDALGDPELPLTPVQIAHKARLLLTQARTVDVNGLIMATLALADGGSIQAFTAKWP